MGIEGKNKEKLGYARVSTDKQDINNQINELIKIGIKPENIYSDENVSGTVPVKKRKGFKKVYERVMNNEVAELYVFEISRIGRTSSEAIQTVLELEQAGCHVISLSPNETWTKDVNVLPGMRNVFLAMFSWFADIERKSISERTKLGLQRARKEGKHLGRPFKEPSKKIYDKIKGDNPKLKPAQIARLMQVPTSTLYRYIKRWEEIDRIQRNREIIGQ